MYFHLILDGLFLGGTLAILLGPIFVTITQISLQKGAKAGLVASSGIWVSDIIIVALAYFFIQKISLIVEDASFTHWMGMLGGLILIGFGIGALLSENNIRFSNTSHTSKDYFSFWTKGFLVNTVNPFTFVFWIGVISTYVIGRKINGSQALVFLSTILGMIIFTDTMKVLAAKVIRHKLKQHHFNIFSKMAGVGLIIFGCILLWRTYSY